MKKIILVLSLLTAIVGCSKPDPNPENKDPIYSDINARLAKVSAELNAEVKTLEGHKKEMTEVTPQTGQIKYAQKRVFESEAKITRLQQEKQYLELKSAARLKYARTSYKAAYNKKESWPDPAELEAYTAEQKLRDAKRSWDVKQRMQDAGVGEQPKSAHKSEKSEGGGHE
jgi:hypothetical protein